jgi:apolipoprotein N-acyltransferase
MSWTKRWSIRVAAIVSGAAASLAFPAPAWWWWGWVGLVSVFSLIGWSPTRREALFRSWLGGAGLLAALHYWLIPNTGLFTVPAAALMGLFWLPLGMAIWAFLRPDVSGWRRWAGLAVVPSVWVLTEWARSWEYLGGTWGLWGLTQWQVGPVVQTAALGGVWLLSFLIVATNVALTSAMLSPGPRQRRLALVGVAAAIPVVMALGGAIRGEPEVVGTVRIAGVQAGVFEPLGERIAAHIELTETLDPSDYDVVVWGQSSVGLDPDQHPDVDEALRSLASTVGADVFVNVDADTGEGITKSTLQYTSEGPVASYSKRRLVPFGEYIPLRAVLGWIGDVSDAASQDRLRGGTAATMTSAGVEIGPLISYESTFPDLRRELARLGAEVTVVQGSSWTFQGTWAQPQQASFEAVRAVESGRPAVLVAVSGTSAAFDARGRRLAWVPADRQEAFVVEVPLSQEDTPYVRFGDWVIWLSAVVLAVVVVEEGVRGPKRLPPCGVSGP